MLFCDTLVGKHQDKRTKNQAWIAWPYYGKQAQIALNPGTLQYIANMWTIKFLRTN